MGRPPREDFEGATHHIYDRGNVGQAVFRDDHDRQEFLRRVIQYGERMGTEILAHCLMTTHFHLVPVTGRTPLSEFMHSLLTSYTRYFNDRWLVRGHLFHGRFGGRRCKTDAEVLGAIRYVHLNPVEAGMVSSPEQWRWSSHNGFLAGNDPVANVKNGLDLFGGLEGYSAFLAQPLAKDARRSLDEIALALAGQIDVDLMRSPSRESRISRLRRCFVTSALQEGYRNSEIAKFLRLAPSAISMIIKRR